MCRTVPSGNERVCDIIVVLAAFLKSLTPEGEPKLIQSMCRAVPLGNERVCDGDQGIVALELHVARCFHSAQDDKSLGFLLLIF